MVGALIRAVGLSCAYAFLPTHGVDRRCRGAGGVWIGDDGLRQDIYCSKQSSTPVYELAARQFWQGTVVGQRDDSSRYWAKEGRGKKKQKKTTTGYNHESDYFTVGVLFLLRAQAGSMRDGAHTKKGTHKGISHARS